jgi:hypothetical protein
LIPGNLFYLFKLKGLRPLTPESLFTESGSLIKFHSTILFSDFVTQGLVIIVCIFFILWPFLLLFLNDVVFVTSYVNCDFQKAWLIWFEAAFVLCRLESSFLVRGNFCRCDYATRRIVDRQICLKKLVEIFLEFMDVNI